MPIWLIEFFGASDLDLAFVLIAVMTAPIWLAMILCPQARLTQAIAQPLLVGLCFAVLLVILLWKSYAAAGFPDLILYLRYDDAQQFARHPVAFLVLFCNLQILNLVLGTVIYKQAQRARIGAHIELVLCWLLGAIALLPFALRLFFKRKSLR